jgi:hypothetical protein
VEVKSFFAPLMCLLNLYLKEFLDNESLIIFGSESHSLIDVGTAERRRECYILADSL